MGYKNNDTCIEKAFDDERMFVLLTRDYSSPKIVLEWIKENIEIQPDEKLREAFECALEMKNKCNEFNIRKMLVKQNTDAIDLDNMLNKPMDI